MVTQTSNNTTPSSLYGGRGDASFSTVTDTGGSADIISQRLNMVQSEIETVKQTLMNPGSRHFGMEGSMLQEYLLQLTKKEVSLLDLSTKHSMNVGPGGNSNGLSNSGGVQQQSLNNNTSELTSLSQSVNNNSNNQSQILNESNHNVVTEQSTQPNNVLTNNLQKPKQIILLEGADPSQTLDKAPDFNKDDVVSCLTYLSYLKDASGSLDEAALLVGKGLRALTSLVYRVSNAKISMENGILEILDKLMTIFNDYGDGTISGFVAGCVCNLAYDSYACDNLMTQKEGVGVRLFVHVLNALSLFPSHAYLQSKGMEAYARLLCDGDEGVDDDSYDEGSTKTAKKGTVNDGTVTTIGNSSSSSSAGSEPKDVNNEYRFYKVGDRSRLYIFTRMLALAKGRVPQINITSQDVAGPSGSRKIPHHQVKEEVFAHASLIETLLQNEAMTIDSICVEIVAHLAEIKNTADEEVILSGICMMISGICNTTNHGLKFSTTLRDGGTIDIMLTLMQKDEIRHLGARAGIEAVARIISTSVQGLRLFLEKNGSSVIQMLMSKHLDDEILQGRAIRALASGTDWPQELQKLANFNFEKLLTLSVNAAKRHSDRPWLLCATFEGFYKFIPRMGPTGGGKNEELIDTVDKLVKEILIKFPKDVKLRAWGSRILEMTAREE